MSSVFELLLSLRRPVAVVVGAVGLAGCSSDSTRFGDFFGAKTSNDYTGSAPAVPAGSAVPAAQVQESRLPPPSEGQPASSEAKQTVSHAPATRSGTRASMQGMASAPKLARETGRVRQPASTAALGGSPTAAATGSTVHVVGPGETLSRIARHYRRSVPDLAKANNIEPRTTLKVGDRLAIPALDSSSKATAPIQKPPVASAASAQTASAAAPLPEASLATPVAKPARDAALSLRWPVKGRVIAGFGPKTNGQQNDGINLAVPEGTPIKAAEDGTVAYAGNELKGYGNLVLVRHPNGYVTAYAHAKELMVKRGDEVKRGQIIANSGQTGNVDAPQLHFEVRKGQSPVDPMPLLSGG
jgi:LysM repeat protein